MKEKANSSTEAGRRRERYRTFNLGAPKLTGTIGNKRKLI